MGAGLVKKGYNEIAKRYSMQRDRYKNNKYLDRLIVLLKPGASILDIGCGAGIPIDKYLFDKGFGITGIDISEKQIELARKNLPTCNFQVKDMSDMSEGEYHVDAVVSFYAVFHIPREKHLDLFKKISTFLPNGGYLLVTMGSSEWEGSEAFHGTTMWWSHYNAEKNEKIIKRAGFKIIQNKIDNSGGEKHQIVLAKKE
jgi:cyclopropane fatty-acyl-phospholipid synthase-like methyltransferase